MVGNHLLLRPHEGENLSIITRWLLGYFARAYNKKRGWTGHFWGDWFHSRILNGIRDFAIAFGYIDENPVKAGLVCLPVEWRHCGAWQSLHGGGKTLIPCLHGWHFSQLREFFRELLHEKPSLPPSAMNSLPNLPLGDFEPCLYFVAMSIKL